MPADRQSATRLISSMRAKARPLRLAEVVGMPFAIDFLATEYIFIAAIIEKPPHFWHVYDCKDRLIIRISYHYHDEMSFLPPPMLSHFHGAGTSGR